MIRNNKKKDAGTKKRSWEVSDDECDQTPSETFLQLQREIAEKERLQKDNEAVIAARVAEEAAQAVMQAQGEAAASDPQGACDQGSARAAETESTRVTVTVTNFNYNCRVHDVRGLLPTVCELYPVATPGLLNDVLTRPPPHFTAL